MINRSDERKQTMYGAGKKSDDDDEAADEGLEVAGGDAPQGERAGSGYGGEDEEEESERSQKSGVMGGKGMKGGADKVKMSQRATESEEEANPARMVNHGRDEAHGHEPEIEGSHQGSGHGGPPAHANTLGHGEREATMSGAHQGQHGTAQKTGSGFAGHGSLSREQARGPSGSKR
jgi:hypothetical protein